MIQPVWLTTETSYNQITYPYAHANLTDLYYNSGTVLKPVFNSTYSISTRRAKLLKLKTSLSINVGNEVDLIQWKVFVVRLRKKGATLYDYEATTNPYQLKPLVNGNHYYQAMTSATTTPGKQFNVWLNPTMFKVLKSYRFNLGLDYAQEVGVMDKVYKNINFSIGNLPWMEAVDEQQYWYQQRTPRLPQQQVFLLMFNDNTGVDLTYPAFSLATMYKVMVYPA